jgi:enamine deaminase RidA (YjgF/YER057c/UK114 family)
MKKTLTFATAALFLAVPLYAQPAAPAQAGAAGPPTEVTYYGSARSAISNGDMIPADRASLLISGVSGGRAPAGQPNDTETQARGALKNIQGQLADHGLTMKDVVYLRAFVVPDPTKDNKMDMTGWGKAYGEFFGTAENPTKPARATIGVAQLVGNGQLIEIEIVAVYPKK